MITRWRAEAPLVLEKLAGRISLPSDDRPEVAVPSLAERIVRDIRKDARV
jgi:hypothetical protein